MSLLSVFTSNASSHVLNASECHYVLSAGNTTCHKLELIVEPQEDSEDLHFLMHGLIVKGDKFSRLANSWISPYNWLMKHGRVFKVLEDQCVEHSKGSGILDCRETYKMHLTTNEGYEGKVEELQKIKYGGGDACRIYGVEGIKIPICELDTKHHDSYSLVNIKQKSGDSFLKNQLYAFRFIFFLTTPKPFYENFKQSLNVIFRGKKTNYFIHLFSLPGNIYDCCREWGLVENVVKESKLFLTLEPFTLRPTFVIQDPAIEINKKEATSDLFIFTKKYSGVSIPIGESSGPDRSKAGINPKYIIFAPENERRELRVRRYHYKFAEDITYTSRRPEKIANNFDKIEVNVDFGLPRIMGLKGFYGSVLIAIYLLTNQLLLMHFCDTVTNTSNIPSSLFYSLIPVGSIVLAVTIIKVIRRTVDTVWY